MTLAAAAAAVEDHRELDAIRALLDVWSQVPDPRIAFAIGELVRTASGRHPGTPPPVLRPDAWDEMCRRRDPIELDGLIANVIKTSAELAADRVTRLAAWKPDPRIGEAIVRWIDKPPFTSRSSLQFWAAVAHAIGVSGDLRLIAAVARAPAVFERAIVTHEVRRAVLAVLASAADRVRDHVATGRTLAPDERAICDEMLATCARRDEPTRSREQVEQMFLARIHADPDDDGARLVFADWLLEHDDARGEAISLAFARRDGRSTKAGAAREARLLREHRVTWTGTLATVLDRKTMVFDRGFLDAVVVRARARLEQTVGDAAWSTVTTIDLAEPHPEPRTSIKLLRDPVMRALRTLRGVTLDVLEPLLTEPVAARLTSIAVTASHGHRDATASALAAGVLPALRHLDWTEAPSAARIASLWTVATRLETIIVRGVSSGVALRIQRVDGDRWDLVLTLPRTVDGMPQLFEIVDAHAARIATVSVVAEGPLDGAFHAELIARGVAVETLIT